MTIIPRWFNQDLTRRITIQHDRSVVFTNDNEAVEVGVHVTNNGQPAVIEGSVAVTVIRSNGTTISIPGGTISGSDVSVVLTKNACAVPGRIGVCLTVVSGGQRVTVLKAVFPVEPTSTNTIVDPDSEITLDVIDLVNKIETAIDSIPADYSDLLAIIAPDFDPDTPYIARAHVWHDGTLYYFTANHAAGPWTGTDVIAANIGGEICEMRGQIAELDSAVDAIDAEMETKANIDGAYSTLTAGSAEQLVATTGTEESVPYNFRTSGGTADIGDREVDKIVGGTVAWNQLITDPTFEDGSKWLSITGGSYSTISVANNVLTMTVITTNASNGISNTNSTVPALVGHKVLFSVFVNPSANCKVRIGSSSAATGAYGLYSTNVTASTWNHLQQIGFVADGNTTQKLNLYLDSVANLSVNDTVQVKNFCAFDLTQMFGSTIADYIYSLEQANEGAGVAVFQKLFPKDYYAYDPGELMSVQAAAHKMVGFNAYNHTTGKAKVIGGSIYQITGAYTSLAIDGTTVTPDASGYFTPPTNGEITVTGGNATTTCIHLKLDVGRDGEYAPHAEYTYPLGDVELRGIPKLDSGNKLYYDGDTYESDGTVTRKFGTRAYQEGDATDGATMITDGTNTVYALTTPTTESAARYTNPQIVDGYGTEEYTDRALAAGTRDVAIPVGHETTYLVDLRKKLESAPELPAAPTTDGSYHLNVTVSNGTPTYSWESDTV